MTSHPFKTPGYVSMANERQKNMWEDYKDPRVRDFPGDAVVENLPFNARGLGLILVGN